MTASVFSSTAMLPGVAVLSGFQIACNDDACATDERGVPFDGAWFRWTGPFRDIWIDAALDAVAHNLTRHGKAPL